MTRSVSSAIISLGLIRIPVKLYTSAMADAVKFCLLSPKGNRIERRNFDTTTGEEVAFEACDRGYEFQKDAFVRFTTDELAALEAEASATVEITEFVPSDLIDPLEIEKTYYLGPDLSDKAYKLLSTVLRDKGRSAVAQWVSHGKEHLVVLAPYHDGIVLHQMFYTNEVRDFGEILSGVEATFTKEELEMASQLVSSLSTNEFVPGEYHDRYADRVRDAIQMKVASHKTLSLPKANGTPRPSGATDLSDLLRASLERLEKPNRKPRRKRVRKAMKEIESLVVQTLPAPESKKGKRRKKGNGAQQTLAV